MIMSIKALSLKTLIAGCGLTLLLAISGASAQTQDASQGKSLTARGKTVAAYLVTVPFGNDGTQRKWVYRVDCGDLYYELEGGYGLSMTVGQEISFRIEKETAYVSDGKKETRYLVVGMGLPDQKQKSH